MRALGAGMELIDVALRIATTPASTPVEWTFKQDFFDRHFEATTRSLDHAHVARVAAAALAAERSLATYQAKVPQ